MWTLRSCKGPLRETSGSNIKIRRFHILRHGLTTSRNIASGARPNPEQAPAAESRLRDCAAKKKSGRLIPIHPSLRTSLAPWRKMTTGTGPVIRSERGGPMTPVSIVNWFAIAYRAVGLEPEATPASGGVRGLGPTCGASASAPIRHSWPIPAAGRKTRCDAAGCHLAERILIGHLVGCRSVDLDARELDHLAPLFSFVSQQRAFRSQPASLRAHMPPMSARPALILGLATPPLISLWFLGDRGRIRDRPAACLGYVKGGFPF
jgi:hypothetical protein